MPVKVHVPPIPAIVKVPPFEAKPAVDLTGSVAPEDLVRSGDGRRHGCWLTVVVSVTGLSAGVPLQPE